MSNPQNILGKFRSYAYHHILLVCNNTATADAISESSEITLYQHPADSSQRYQPRVLNGNEDHKYITLIDGTTDAKYYITGVTWETIIAMEDYVGDGNIPQSSSMSLEGEMSIMEPLGANYLNTLTDSCDYLETDPVGLVFLLKTIFVGHRDDGDVEMISTIKPLLFMNYDITAIFDSSGAKYTMTFVGITNGLGKMPQVQQTVSGFSFKLQPGLTLAETFANLTTAVNASYGGFKDKALSDYAKKLYENSKKDGAVIDPLEAAFAADIYFDEKYRDVSYNISAGEYDDKKFIAGDNMNVRTENKLKDGSYNFGIGVGIETIIKKIMASSKGVMEDGQADATGRRYIYKIVSGLESTPTSYTVKYYVKKYEMVMMPFEAAFKGEEYTPPDGQAIVFDYIFTGKNVDIKEFDIKMEMGMAFFQLAATTESVPTQATSKKGLSSQTYNGTGDKQVASNNKVVRDKTPLFLGSKLVEPMARNVKNPIESATFQALLNRHAALESVEAKMTIFGNPQLLNEMQIQSKDLETPDTETPEKDKTINPKWMNVPTLVKVNVKMPVDANDVNTEYRDFWYTGYYTLFAVKHIFEGGEFLQELDMLSMPVSDELDNTSDSKTAAEVSEKTDAANLAAIDEFFDIEPVAAAANEKNADEQTVEQSKQSQKKHKPGRSANAARNR